MTRIATGLLLAVGLAGVAHAQQPDPLQAQLDPMQATSLELGAITGVAYYTIADDGFRVVATLAAGEAGTPMRFTATLTPGQGVVVSVPWALDETARQLEIKRNGDIVTVSEFRPVVAER